MKRAVSILSVGLLALAAGAGEAGDLNPPLVGMADRFDPIKTISIQLPVNWTDRGPDTRYFGGVMRWEGFFQKPQPSGPDAQLEVGVKPTWSRAELAFWGDVGDRPGVPVDGSTARGDGWVEINTKEDAKQKHYLFRYVESHGQVFKLAAYGHESIQPHIQAHLRAVFDTFKVLQKWPGAKPPDGYAKSEDAGREVWTDTKDKKSLKRSLDAHAAAWAEMKKALPGDPAIKDPPVIVVCDKDAAYTQFTTLATNKNSPTSVYDYQRRMLVVRAAGRNNAMFDEMTQEFAGSQYLQHYFGGKVPDWVDRGLAKWGAAAALSKGKPEKPPAEFVRAAKEAVAARGERLDAALEVRREHVPEAQANQLDMSFYAWHCWLRFGNGGKTYGERYQKYLDALRATGAPDEAKKEWDGVDFAAMHKEFQAWAAAWKP
jgi:hypothetical protein